MNSTSNPSAASALAAQAARPASRRDQRAFTLIELMVTVAIIGILATVAYPSYRDYIVRGYLVDATNGLSTMRAQMERHYQDQRKYTTTGSFTSPCANTSAAGTASRTFGKFEITCSGTGDLAADAYKLTATGAAGPVLNFRYTINQLGVQTSVFPSGSGFADCASQWIVKKGQPCS